MAAGTYAYDAYGNTTITSNPLGVANWNPFRYRGYYQDQETGFYYLQSRYYDPQTGRFISADEPSTILINAATIGGTNLYAYCLNNPIMETDPTGESVIAAILIAAGIGALVNTVGQLAIDIISYGITGEWNGTWQDYVGAAIGGAIGGASSFIPGVGPCISSAVVGFTSAFISQGLQSLTGDSNRSLLQILGNSVLSGAVSFVAAGVVKAMKIPGLNAGRGSYEAVSKQMYTKLSRDIIKNVSLKTLGKMATVIAAYGTLDCFIKGIWGPAFYPYP